MLSCMHVIREKKSRRAQLTHVISTTGWTASPTRRKPYTVRTNPLSCLVNQGRMTRTAASCPKGKNDTGVENTRTQTPLCFARQYSFVWTGSTVPAILEHMRTSLNDGPLNKKGTLATGVQPTKVTGCPYVVIRCSCTHLIHHTWYDLFNVSSTAS